MDHRDQITAFENDLKALIYRYRSEFELTVAAAIGTLELAKLNLYCEAMGIEPAPDCL
jgi:hypothetical protein